MLHNFKDMLQELLVSFDQEKYSEHSPTESAIFNHVVLDTQDFESAS